MNIQLRRVCALLFTISAVMPLWSQATAMSSDISLVVNPYKTVDWEQFGHYKANLHTHTTESDGSLSPAATIDLYHSHGYNALAITDHDRCAWPWQRYERSAEALGMVAIPGNELSRHHHVLSLFCEYETDHSDLDAAVAGAAQAGGIAILCHPAMHWEPAHSEASRLRRFLDESARPEEAPPAVVQEYVALFQQHPHLIATEISNASEPLYRYPLDRRLWDQLLTEMMPERPIWGVNTDDMHTLDHFGMEFVMLLAPQLDASSLRDALVNGAFYFSTRRVPDTASTASAAPPRIVAITHDETNHTLRVQAVVNDTPLPDTAYVWISDGAVVHTGSTLAYSDTPGIGVYARLEITADSGVTFTNPFGFNTQRNSE